jgi:flagellar hook-length control protein FliK
VQGILSALESKVSQFTTLLKAQAANNANNTPAPTPLSDAASSMLKTSISQVSDQLQTLQTINIALFRQAQASLQAQLAQGPATTDTNPNTAPKDNSATNAASLPQLAANSNVPLPVINTTPDTLVNAPLIATALQSNIAQNGADTSSGNNSGSGQNQSMPQPVMVPSASQPTAATNAAANLSFARMLGQASQPSVLDQVSFNIKTAVTTGDSKISIQLQPEGLGKLDISFNVSADGKATSVNVTADNQGTLNLLKADTQGLTRALNDAGLRADSGSLSFNLSQGGQQQNSGQDQTASQAANIYLAAQPEDEGVIPAASVISRSYVLNVADGLDISI